MQISASLARLNHAGMFRMQDAAPWMPLCPLLHPIPALEKAGTVTPLQWQQGLGVHVHGRGCSFLPVGLLCERKGGFDNPWGGGCFPPVLGFAE